MKEEKKGAREEMSRWIHAFRPDFLQDLQECSINLTFITNNHVLGVSPTKE
jgi:hypothetical protein